MNDDHTDLTTNKSRRSFLFVLPLGVLAGVFTSISAAAFRFLRPRVSAASDQWVEVATLSELTGPQPLGKKIIAEHVAGWAVTTEEHRVYVLPAKNNQVLSAVCPHEGCEVGWDGDMNRFACPCHESYFAADGSRLNGPAGRGLDPLPTRVQNGKLQVLYRSNNNGHERAMRA